MRKLFVDTGAWLAIADRADQLHRRAAAFYRRSRGRVLWLTSDFILDELATRLRAIQDAQAAVDFVRAVRRTPACQVLSVDADTFDAALGLMLKFSDHRLSMTDCTSFALMKANGLREAFAFDEDFTRCGFVALP